MCSVSYLNRDGGAINGKLSRAACHVGDRVHTKLMTAFDCLQRGRIQWLLELVLQHVNTKYLCTLKLAVHKANTLSASLVRSSVLTPILCNR